jgi:hypothetical protein
MAFLFVVLPWSKILNVPWIGARLVGHLWIVYAGITIGILSFLPLLLLIFIIYNHSVRLLIAQDILLVCLGGTFVWWVARRSRAGRTRKVAQIVVGFLFLAVGSGIIVGDYLLPRRHVVGTVDRIVSSWEFGPRYDVYLDGQMYLSTSDLLNSLAVGRRVMIDVGVGSKHIFRVVPASGEPDFAVSRPSIP